jgi:hypothetical protein
METPMTKKIAVIVRDRQAEALRMAIGIILLDDTVDVYVLDQKVEETEQNELYLETLQFMDMKAFSNYEESDKLAYLTTEEIALRLSGYDHVLAY